MVATAVRDRWFPFWITSFSLTPLTCPYELPPTLFTTRSVTSVSGCCVFNDDCAASVVDLAPANRIAFTSERGTAVPFTLTVVSSTESKCPLMMLPSTLITRSGFCWAIAIKVISERLIAIRNMIVLRISDSPLDQAMTNHKSQPYTRPLAGTYDNQR